MLKKAFYKIGVGVVVVAVGWALSNAHADSVQPIVATGQVGYGSAQKTITSNSDVVIDTGTHVFTAAKGLHTSSITFDNGSVLNSSGVAASVPWGGITGNISDQTDLQTRFNNVATSTNTLHNSIVSLQSTVSNLVTSVASSTSSLQTQIYAVGVTTGNLQTAIDVVAGNTSTLTASVNALGVSTGTLKTQINAVAVATGTIQTQVNNIVVSTAGLAVSTASLQSQINSLGTTYLTNSSATATYLSQVEAGQFFLTQSSATATYLQLNIASSTYANKSIFSSASSTGVLSAQDWRTFSANTPVAGGASSLAITTGTSAGFSSVRSSPTAVLNFDKDQFSVAPISGATAYTSLNASSVTLQGNTFNIANKLIQMTSGGQYPALDGNLITNLNPNNIAGGVIQIGNSLQVGSTFYVSSGTVSDFTSPRVYVSSSLFVGNGTQFNHFTVYGGRDTFESILAEIRNIGTTGGSTGSKLYFSEGSLGQFEMGYLEFVDEGSNGETFHLHLTPNGLPGDDYQAMKVYGNGSVKFAFGKNYNGSGAIFDFRNTDNAGDPFSTIMRVSGKNASGAANILELYGHDDSTNRFKVVDNGATTVFSSMSVISGGVDTYSLTVSTASSGAGIYISSKGWTAGDLFVGRASTVTVVTGAGAGTVGTSTASVTGVNSAGIITLGSSGSPSVGGAIVTITPSISAPTKLICVIAGTNVAAAGAVQNLGVTSTASTWTISSLAGTSLSSTTAYTFSYLCGGY